MLELGTVKDVFQVIIQFATIITLVYTLYKFSRKPHDTLEDRHNALEKRVDEHDVKLKEHEESLHQGNDRFREQQDVNKLFMNCMLSFIDFERAYCAHTGYEDTDDLEEARAELRKYLAGK